MAASSLPGISVRTQRTSWPLARSATTASLGTFSSATIRIAQVATGAIGKTRSALRVALA